MVLPKNERHRKARFISKVYSLFVYVFLNTVLLQNTICVDKNSLSITIWKRTCPTSLINKSFFKISEGLKLGRIYSFSYIYKKCQLKLAFFIRKLADCTPDSHTKMNEH